MADTGLSPPLFREALVYRGPLTLTESWQRWLGALWQQVQTASGTPGPEGPAGPPGPEGPQGAPGTPATLGPTLTTIEALTGATNTMLYFTGTDVAALTALTAFARTLLDDPDATTMRATLGLSAMVPQVSTAVATASPGASVLTVPGLVPVGVKLWCVLTRIETTFSAAGGLEAMQIGDSTMQDGFGQLGLTAGLTTSPEQMRRGDAPWVPPGYMVLVQALGGTFGASGALTLKAIYSVMEPWGG